MSSADELMSMAHGWVAARVRAAIQDNDYAPVDASRDALRAALTNTLAERDARIAELEQKIGGLRLAPYAASPTKDDRRRFVDECAMRIMAAGMFSENVDEDVSRDLVGLSYDAAEALAEERDRRMQG